MASWLVCSSPARAVRVRALAGDIVLCSWARHFTLVLPLSTQVYKWVLANFMLGVTLRWTSIPSRGEQKYSQSLHATETGISSGLMGHLARMQTLPLPIKLNRAIRGGKWNQVPVVNAYIYIVKNNEHSTQRQLNFAHFQVSTFMSLQTPTSKKVDSSSAPCQILSPEPCNT